MTPKQADQSVSSATTAGDNEIPHCAACGSTAILRDAWARWDPASQDYELAAVFDYAYCEDCDGEASVDWRKPDSSTIGVTTDR